MRYEGILSISIYVKFTMYAYKVDFSAPVGYRPPHPIHSMETESTDTQEVYNPVELDNYIISLKHK